MVTTRKQMPISKKLKNEFQNKFGLNFEFSQNIEYNFFNEKTLVLAIFDFDRFSKHDQIHYFDNAYTQNANNHQSSAPCLICTHPNDICTSNYFQSLAHDNNISQTTPKTSNIKSHSNSNSKSIHHQSPLMNF